MKKLIVFTLLVLVPVLASAQTLRLINRIDEQTDSRIEHTGHSVTFLESKPLLIQASQQKQKSFSITLHDTIANFTAGPLASLSGPLKNLTSHAVNVVFVRTHLRLPANCTSSICFGASCYAAFVDSNTSHPFSLDSGTASTFIWDISSSDSLSSDSLVDYIKFTALNGDPSDTLSFLLKGILIPIEAGVQDNLPKPVTSNPKITAIYPSPLVQGNAIKVKVLSPRESNLSYSIYDALGRVIALGVTRQHIGLGDNTVSINSLDGLINGSYMLKLTFADGSSDTHFFQVLR